MAFNAPKRFSSNDKSVGCGSTKSISEYPFTTPPAAPLQDFPVWKPLNPVSDRRYKAPENRLFDYRHEPLCKQITPDPSIDELINSIAGICVDPSRKSNITAVQTKEFHDPCKNFTDTSLYKTKLCTAFNERGRCLFGNNCRFAHGLNELRKPLRHPKYRTQLCRAFFEDNFCQYGKDCNYLHFFPQC
ncbi:hypothetical protein DSO57_1025505 [Entomophthora muscae]|uniref:Uncharacterized protein n=1 Tax=Entomophthora muscae TaxID=34485 RepID=A0ACC2SFC0_9FUNG|nr:hypothetical protein DSO57_1025505 [Entomophthora muscae]